MLSIKRLRKENLTLQSEPVPLAVARPIESNILEWRFLIKGSDDYEGGYYHGKLIFPPQYPMKPPGIMFFTPSGRFEINKRVCLTISDFHPESWSPLWTVGSILTGIVSFMNSDEMTTGGLAASSKERKAFALASTAYNAKDHVYTELFGSSSPAEIFEEADRKLEENVKKRMELRDIQQKASEASRTPDMKTAGKNVPSGAAGIRPAFTNVASLKSSGEVAAPVTPGVSVGAESKAGGLTKSAKKRIKEKERAQRQKENGIESYLSPGLSSSMDSDCDDDENLQDMNDDNAEFLNEKSTEDEVSNFKNLKISSESS